ncbi:MAG: hypothetical protein ABR585_14540, partial [Gemmatimonadaceae bacterium]
MSSGLDETTVLLIMSEPLMAEGLAAIIESSGAGLIDIAASRSDASMALTRGYDLAILDIALSRAMD